MRLWVIEFKGVSRTYNLFDWKVYPWRSSAVRAIKNYKKNLPGIKFRPKSFVLK